MKWPRRRKTADVVSEGTRARIAAEAALARTRAETPAYADLGRRLRAHREANHLTELFFAKREGTR